MLCLSGLTAFINYRREHHSCWHTVRSNCLHNAKLNMFGHFFFIKIKINETLIIYICEISVKLLLDIPLYTYDDVTLII